MLNVNCHMYHKKKGFTLVEFLVALGILLFLGISAVLLLKNQSLGNLESDAEAIASRLSEAQSRAIAGVENRQWGIHFENTANPFYALFNGPSYSAASTTYYLSAFVEFQSPASGTSTDIIFTKLSGTISAATSVIIRLKSNTTQTKTVTVSSQGKTTVE